MTMNDTDLNALIADLKVIAAKDFGKKGDAIFSASAALVQLRDERDTARAAIVRAVDLLDTGKETQRRAAVTVLRVALARVGGDTPEAGA